MKRIHEGQKEYGYSYKKGQSKNFKCGLCEKNFINKRVLKIHIQGVHKGKNNHKCLQCDKMFSQKHHMEKHVRIVHSRIRNFICDICDKEFTYSHTLKQHMNHHGSTIIKPSIDCQKDYENSHKKEQRKNFQCFLCEKNFITKHILKVHIQRSLKKHIEETHHQ